jgi:hypothetical protein
MRRRRGKKEGGRGTRDPFGIKHVLNDYVVIRGGKEREGRRAGVEMRRRSVEVEKRKERGKGGRYQRFLGIKHVPNDYMQALFFFPS